jgi:hypothetical protein
MKKESKNLPLIKKNLKTFLLSEEGKMTKKDIVKMTAVVIAVAGVLSVSAKPTDSFTQQCNHGSHASHGSHGSHSSGGWC